jgi:cell division protein YceG involved in septum cleavage
MDKKITKEHRPLIEEAKNKILNLGEQQNRIFDELIEQLNVESENDITWIFDFIHNAGQLSDGYYEMVENTIFE